MKEFAFAFGGTIRFQIIKKELLNNLLIDIYLLKDIKLSFLKENLFLNDLISLLFENFKDEQLSNSRNSSSSVAKTPLLRRSISTHRAVPGSLAGGDRRSLLGRWHFVSLWPSLICFLLLLASLPKVNLLKLCCPCDWDFQLAS